MSQQLLDDFNAAHAAYFQEVGRRTTEIMDANPDRSDWDVAVIIWEKLYDMKPEGPDDSVFLGQVDVVRKYRKYKAALPS